jgi:hypothetical protein
VCGGGDLRCCVRAKRCAGCCLEEPAGAGACNGRVARLPNLAITVVQELMWVGGGSVQLMAVAASACCNHSRGATVAAE